MNRFIFRQAQESDCHELSELAHELNMFHNINIKPDVRKLAQDWPFLDVSVVTNTQNKILSFIQGYETYQPHNAVRGYEIQNLYIRKDMRGHGLGKKLVSNLVEKKYALDIKQLKLTVIKENSEAISFYKI